jgi:ferritin-like metal-binding protein YciE
LGSSFERVEPTVFGIVELIMRTNNLGDAFYDELCDIYHAEKQLSKALPKMIKATKCKDLKAALTAHLEETIEQIGRIEVAFEDTGKPARAKKCEAMKGLIVEAASTIEDDAEPDVRDALLIACAQKIEHYEIATYGTLCTWAKLLGFDQALVQLKLNMGEEESADKKLTQLSKKINVAACV